MIVGIGIDTIDIDRFSTWQTLEQEKLKRVFTAEEIAYCISVPAKTSERLAARFAAKEAFYKAFSCAYPQHALSFWATCKAINIHSTSSGRPELDVAWNVLQKDPLKIFVSLSHTATLATAIVILEKLEN